MSENKYPSVEIRLDTIVGGGQTLGTMADGRKLFAWGGLPGETVTVQLTKRKQNYAEGFVTEVLQESPDRTSPRDTDSYLSTSPWQIMTFEAEQRYKAKLINEAFELHHVNLPATLSVFTDERQYEYRNKIEFSFWWDKDRNELDLAFFKRGSHGKVPVNGTSLAMPAINEAARTLRDLLRARGDEAYHFKTAIFRSDQKSNVVAQLYTKTRDYQALSDAQLTALDIQGFELIYSDHKSPASVITKRLQKWGDVVLSDDILSIPFTYAAESFFQVNIPVYQQALMEIKKWVEPSRPVLDLYSGVGSLGLTVAPGPLTLVEINPAAVEESNRIIRGLRRENTAKAILSPSEAALDYISSEATVIVDPPRAGLHSDVVERLLAVKPPRIIYLSCNPVTQARDVGLLLGSYEIQACFGYNFFPRTPHIENLIILDSK